MCHNAQCLCSDCFAADVEKEIFVKSLLMLALVTSGLAAAEGHRFGPSPRDMLLEFKLASYTPQIDTAENKPYATVFGAPMLMGELEFDYQFFQKFGSLSGGLSLGFAEKFAKAFIAGTTDRSSNSTGLRMLPIKALLIYRFDVLSEKFAIPFVPYLKGGGVLMPWWATKGPDIEVASDGSRGAGTKIGLTGVVGLALQLDFLDRRMARDFDTGIGVNHSYVFAEFATQQMNFGDLATNTLPLNLSSNTFMFGLALEF
jgi:hypothetical protein